MKEGRSWRSDTVARLHPRKRSQRYLYIGVPNDLARRAWEHREGLVAGFTKRYAVKRLVYIESFDRIEDAIAREKAMKKWNRLWKLDAIERANPDWDDLYELGL